MKLNEYQERAVNHLDGPCIVTSCPGSGKTFVLVERILKLIERGVRPQNILCITFTNKAANEMKERICKRLNIKKPNFFIGTFHSLCANILRKMGRLAGYPSNFTILDDKDQIDLIMQVSRQMNFDINKIDAQSISNAMNHFRDQLEEDSWLEERLTNVVFEKIARGYFQRCKTSSLVDFSGLIFDTIKMIEGCEEIRTKLQTGFKYILVDETQDTNGSQYHLVNLLGDKWKNIMLIGDQDQCVVEGEFVKTNNGEKRIEEIKIGDVVSAGRGGGGEIVDSKVLQIYKKEVIDYDIVNIITKGGREVRFSKEHVVFADYVVMSPKKIIVYLMYDENIGYRVGVTNTKRKYGASTYGGLKGRLQQERATYMWILKAVDTISEAKYWEQYYSIKYGISTWCFYAKGRNLDYTDNDIKKIFRNIDTFANAEVLMKDALLFKDKPHYVPKCMCKKRRRNFTINLCADSRFGTIHRYMISGSDNNDAKLLSKLGLNVRKNGKERRGWRVESAHNNLKDIYDILTKVRAVMDVNLIERIKLGKISLPFIPASHLREGMGIFVEKDGKVIIDEIKKVTFEKYTGNLYDIDVERYHNFITNGIFSHNSIYGWRGARYTNIQNFVNRHTDCTIIPLSKNYRSSPQIVKVADRLIKHNIDRIANNFETDNSSGEPVRCYCLQNQILEANWVASQIEKLIKDGGWDPEDIAILYRINKMSEPIEQSLSVKGIAYDVIGGWNFYDRKEVRDCLSMLKFLLNKKDGIAFHRICSLLKGMGDTTIGRIENRAVEKNIDIIEATKEIRTESNSVNIRSACDKVVEIFSKNYDFSKPGKCMLSLVSDLDFEKYLHNNFSKNAIERMDNVNQVTEAASRFGGYQDGIERYLQNVSLVTGSDKDVEGNKVSLMSLHAAKGLEFPIVFMIGVENNILPHSRAVVENDNGLEEERRLCYVGMTRAKKLLYITYCKKRHSFGQFGNAVQRPAYPSLFLRETGLIKENNG